jgi:hypothetical protein
MLEKGIIISPDFSFDGRTLEMRGLSGQTLRQCLLYWDNIEFPTSNIINIGTSPDLQFLIDEGVLQRTDIRLEDFSGNIGYGVIRTQIEALKRMNEIEPGQWSLAQSSNALCLIGDKAKEEELIEFELHKCMPIPTSDIPFQEILEFKLKRKDEYTAFKNYIGELYLEVVNSNDVPRSKVQVINRLEAAIADIDKVTSESFAKRIMKSFSLNLNPINLSAHGLSGVGAATLFGIPLSLGAAAGAIAGAINFNLNKQSVPEVMYQDQKGLAYLMNAKGQFDRKVVRNEWCPCGSGKKYKKCCIK